MIGVAFQPSGRHRSMAWIAAVEPVSVTKVASPPAQGDWVGAGNPRLRLTESCWLMAEYHALNFRGGVAALDFAGPTQRA